MSAYSYRTSRPNNWVMPRQNLDGNQRLQAYGPIQPMDSPSLLERFFGKR